MDDSQYRQPLATASTVAPDADVWQLLDADNLPVGRVLLTNNLTARNAHGQMSHVWVGIPFKSEHPDNGIITDGDGEWVCAYNLTHWRDVPRSSEAALSTPPQDEKPVIGGDGPPVASCLLCGINGPLAVWYGSTRAGVCDDCRKRAALSTPRYAKAMDLIHKYECDETYLTAAETLRAVKHELAARSTPAQDGTAQILPDTQPAIWSCKIGECDRVTLPRGADGPLRQAVSDAYLALVGTVPRFIFSGWGAALTTAERNVVEEGPPSNPQAPVESTPAPDLDLRQKVNVLAAELNRALDDDRSEDIIHRKAKALIAHLDMLAAALSRPPERET